MADRYLLESGAPDGYLLEDASGVLLLELTAGGQPFFMWAKRSGPALYEEVLDPTSYSRRPAPRYYVTTSSISGTAQTGLSSIVLVQGEPNASRANHNLLHQYRTGFQTVGRASWTLTDASNRVEAESDIQRQTDHTVLHAFRKASPTQAVAPWPLLWYKTARPRVIDGPEFFGALGQSGVVFQDSVTPPAGAGQPWYIQNKAKWSWGAEEQELRRTDHSTFFRLLGIQSPTTLAYSFDVPDLNALEWQSPWHRTTDHARALYPFRSTSTQQNDPLRIHRKSTFRVEEEAPFVRGSASSLHAFRSPAPTAVVGQPFFMWDKKPNQTLYEDRFFGQLTASAPVFQDSITPPINNGSTPFFLWNRPNRSFWWTDEEVQVRRQDNNLLFRFLGPATSVYLPYTVEVPDLNGPEWLEDPVRRLKHDLALFPFRSTIQQTPSGPWHMFPQTRVRIDDNGDVQRVTRHAELLGAFRWPTVINTSIMRVWIGRGSQTNGPGMRVFVE